MKNKNICQHKGMCTDICRNFSNYSQKLETTEHPLIEKWLNNMWYNHII